MRYGMNDENYLKQTGKIAQKIYLGMQGNNSKDY